MGGKSRKSGGVSRKLLAHIKQGKFPTTRTIKLKVTTTDEATGITALFETGRGTAR
jgi:hypothetical protein